MGWNSPNLKFHPQILFKRIIIKHSKNKFLNIQFITILKYYTGVNVGYLICNKCKSYYKLQSGESAKDFVDKCDCGGKIRYIQNLDIIDPQWKPFTIKRKPSKKEILQDKMQSIFTFRKINLKNHLQQFYYNNIGKHIQNNRNQYTIHNNSYGMQSGFMNSIRNELNFHNIQWILVIPATILITLILGFGHGLITLLTFILLIIVGYLSKNIITGTKNALIIGAVSYFIGTLLIGAYLYLIIYILLGIVNGLICGFLGAYLKIIIQQSKYKNTF